MRPHLPARATLACLLTPLLGPCLLSQMPAPAQSKPSAAIPLSGATPTPAKALVATAPSTPVSPAQRPPHRAEVTFLQDRLVVNAENSSLNQILREIGRQTGIAITGGVAEERVFGKYGPSPASDVLTALLEGTGSNMMLIPAEPGVRGQLILTPRHGGPTPPNPAAPGFDDDSTVVDDEAVPTRPRNTGVSLFGQNPIVDTGQPNQVPVNTADPAGAAAGAVDTQSPNGIKTPQEIFQQLQLLRQQQQQQQQTAPPPDDTP